MRSSSPLLSYQQVLDTRQCPLSEREVTVLLVQLLNEISRLHTKGYIHGNLSLDHLWRDVEGELYMHPAAEFRLGWTARDDVRSLAQITICLLTNQPFQSDWQAYATIRKPLAQVLAASLNFTAECPIRDATDLLQALHRINSPQPLSPIPAAPPRRSHWLNTLGMVAKSVCVWTLKLSLGALVLGTAGWLAYEHFRDFLPDPPRRVIETTPQESPTLEPVRSPDQKLILPRAPTPDLTLSSLFGLGAR